MGRACNLLPCSKVDLLTKFKKKFLETIISLYIWRFLQIFIFLQLFFYHQEAIRYFAVFFLIPWLLTQGRGIYTAINKDELIISAFFLTNTGLSYCECTTSSPRFQISKYEVFHFYNDMEIKLIFVNDFKLAAILCATNVQEVNDNRSANKIVIIKT